MFPRASFAVCPSTSEVNHDASGQAHIVLVRSEESRLHVITLDTPRNKANQAIVESTAESCGERKLCSVTSALKLTGQPIEGQGTGTFPSGKFCEP